MLQLAVRQTPTAGPHSDRSREPLHADELESCGLQRCQCSPSGSSSLASRFRLADAAPWWLVVSAPCLLVASTIVLGPRLSFRAIGLHLF